MRIFQQADGSQSRGTTEYVARDAHTEALATRFLQAGGWYLIHKVGDNVRLTCADMNLDVLTGLEIKNGPDLGQAIDDLVLKSQDFIKPYTASEALSRKSSVPLIH